MSSVCLKITSLLFIKAQNCKGGDASRLRVGSGWEEKDNSFAFGKVEPEVQLGNSCAYSKGPLGAELGWERRAGLKDVGAVRIKAVTKTHSAGALGFPGRAWGLIRVGHSLRKACFSWVGNSKAWELRREVRTKSRRTESQRSQGSAFWLRIWSDNRVWWKTMKGKPPGLDSQEWLVRWVERWRKETL